MIRVGLVGLPNAGKSTLFNCLTGANALVAPYPFSTVVPNKANLKLFDPIARDLAAAVGAPDIQYTEVEVWDIAGLIKNASEGEGLGNEFLGQIKDCNIIVHVVRIDGQSTVDSVRTGMTTVLSEIALFDHKCLLKPFEKGRRMTRLYPHDTGYAATDKILSKAYYGTKEGSLIYDVLSANELPTVHGIGLVSATPRIVLLNTDGSEQATAVLNEIAGDVTANLLELAALFSMTQEDRQFLGYSDEPMLAFLEAFCGRLVSCTASKRFYTVGHLGVGQWIVPTEADGKACAELVHADIGDSLKSIKAAAVRDFMQQKSWANLIKQGMAKKYGPTHVPLDTDVLYFEVS